jgi:hypothetical protein
MLKPGTKRRKLPIIVSPDGGFFYPTHPAVTKAEAEEERAKTVGRLLAGKKDYFWQKVVPTTEKIFFFEREVWQATGAIAKFEDNYPQGWQILKGRPFRVPEEVTPEQAKKSISNGVAR